TVLSAFVAFTLDPMLSARFAKQRGEGEVDRLAWLKAPFVRFFEQMDAVYLAILKWLVKRPPHMWITLGSAVGLLVLAGALAGIMGSEFVTLEDRGQFEVTIELPAGTALEETSERSRVIEEEFAHDPRFQTIYATIGANGAPNVAEWRVICV